MFGKPAWFKSASGGLGVVPAAWQGWLYFLIWGFVLGAPTLALLLTDKPLEGAIWLAVSLGMLIRDTRQVVHEKRREELFVIDEDTDVTKISTDKFDLELRQ